MGAFRGFRERKAVSPIIAMILLVAIVVVLAAVLYVFVGGLSHTTAKPPIGSALYAGPARDVTGSAATNAYCAKSHYCYAIPLDEVGTGLSVGSVGFEVLTSTDTPHIVTMNSAKVSLVNPSSVAVASTPVAKGKALSVTSWTSFGAGTSDNTPLSTLLTIWIQFGDTKTPPYNQGMSLNIIGLGQYSGVVNVPLP